jgi:hypothetical protein
MRLQVMRKTMEAMAEMDLEVAKRLMAIAELMAETHPRKLMTQNIDDLVTEHFEIIRRSAPKNGTDLGEAASEMIIGGIHIAPFTIKPAMQNVSLS